MAKATSRRRNPPGYLFLRRSFARMPRDLTPETAFPSRAGTLSLTIVRGLARTSNSVASSRATLAPDREASAIRATHFRLQSSARVMTRKRRPSVSWSETKSSDQIWSGMSDSAIGARVPITRHARRSPIPWPASIRFRRAFRSSGKRSHGSFPDPPPPLAPSAASPR